MTYMLGKYCHFITFKMEQLSASGTFHVEMVSTAALRKILIQRSTSVCRISLDYSVTAQIGKLSVYSAFTGSTAVDEMLGYLT